MSSPDPAAVRDLFEEVAPAYDRFNDLFSLGLHRLWKRQAIAWVRPAAGQHLLDLCCGTGDLALLLAARVRPGGSVLGLDAAAAPLEVARRRAARRPWLPLHWRQADALRSGLPDHGADGAVIAYGLRNLADPAAGLVELRRLLRDGSRAAVLDFNHLDPAALPPGPERRRSEAVAGLQRLLLRRVVVPVAGLAGLAERYAYLQGSIDRFPDGPRQERLARAAGFRLARHRPLAGGLMGLLQLVA